MSYFDDIISLRNFEENDSKAELVSEIHVTDKISNLIFEKNIKLGEEIGFQKARTYIADYEDADSTRKVVAKEIDSIKSFNKIEQYSRLKSLLNIKSENIIDHIGFVEPTSNDKLPLIVMEFMEGETLRNRLMRSEKIDLEVAFDWALQIAKGMFILHENETIHRDLSSRNIMISTDSNSEAKLKLIDIGDEQARGTPINMAPEAYDEKKELTKESDVFSFGTILWEILTCLKEQPFDDLKLNQIETGNMCFKIAIQKKTLKIPDYCDEKLAELMQDCWKYAPKERPSFKEICLRLEIQKLDLLEENNESDLDETTDVNSNVNNVEIPSNLPVFLFMD